MVAAVVHTACPVKLGLVQPGLGLSRTASRDSGHYTHVVPGSPWLHFCQERVRLNAGHLVHLLSCTWHKPSGPQQQRTASQDKEVRGSGDTGHRETLSQKPNTETGSLKLKLTFFVFVF